jgi:hypothetical protein
MVATMTDTLTAFQLATVDALRSAAERVFARAGVSL